MKKTAQTARPRTTAAGQRLIEAMEDAVAYVNGDPAAGRIVFPRPPRIDVAAVRAKTGLSQSAFARKFMLAPGTVRNWEQGVREPDGPARLLLALIDRAPDIVSEVADDLARA